MPEILGGGANVDGRSMRRERNTASVIEAALALLAAGVLSPSAQMLADRSGVSLRSLFRYFDSLDDLLERAVEQVLPPSGDRTCPLGTTSADVAARTEHFVAHRLSRYERDGAVLRSAQWLARKSPAVEALVAADATWQLDVLTAVFAPELGPLGPDDRAATTGVVHIATSFPTWDELRNGHGLTEERTGSIMRRAVRGALTEPV